MGSKRNGNAGPARLRVTVHAVPGASATEAAGLYGDALRVRVAGVPVDGKANAVLQRWLADTLHVAPSAVTLCSGHKARRKVFELTFADADAHGRAVAIWQALRQVG